MYLYMHNFKELKKRNGKNKQLWVTITFYADEEECSIAYEKTIRAILRLNLFH